MRSRPRTGAGHGLGERDVEAGLCATASFERKRVDAVKGRTVGPQIPTAECFGATASVCADNGCRNPKADPGNMGAEDAPCATVCAGRGPAGAVTKHANGCPRPSAAGHGAAAAAGASESGRQPTAAGDAKGTGAGTTRTVARQLRLPRRSHTRQRTATYFVRKCVRQCCV